MRQLNMSLIYFFGSLGGLLFGYDTGVISGAILFIEKQLALGAWGLGWVVSSVLLGAVLASLFIGPLSDRYGRRKLILAAAVVFFAGSIGSGIASGFTTLVVSRVLLGFGVGIASSLIPTYLSEVSPADKRGSLTGLFQFMVMTGILLAYVSNYALSGPQSGWRWMLGLAALPSLVLFLGALILPESPRFLVKTGRTSEARHVLLDMYKGDPAVVDSQLTEIKRQAQMPNGGWNELFGSMARPALFAAIGLAVFQQIMGL